MDGPSPIGQQQYYTPPPRSPAPAPAQAQARAPSPVMQPFRTLVASVKRCPWAAVSDVGARGQDAPDDAYYPPVPRSLLHDTAVSFVVKDHTRPDLPEFVISCPFEHVDLVHQLLAPDGSHRQLSARGTSGQPRSGGQLRSMLLDGTPSIELALHAGLGGGVGPSSSRQGPRPGDGGDGGGGGGGGGGAAVGRRPRFANGPVTPRRGNTEADRVYPFWGGNNGGRHHTQSMIDANGHTAASPSFHPGDLFEPEVENPRTNWALASPLSTPTPLRAPAPSSSSAPSPGPEHTGSTLGYFSPSPLHLQATVESAPPTPPTGPVKMHRDDPTAVSPQEGREEDGNEDEMEESGDRVQEGGGSMVEAPALVYVQPSTGQLERGVPLTGWLCDPEWLRSRLRDLTLGNTQGHQ